MPITACPDRETLRKLLLGDLPAAHREQWSQHMETCDECATTSDTIMATDDLTEAIQARRVLEGDEDAISRVIERGKTLHRSSKVEQKDTDTSQDTNNLNETAHWSLEKPDAQYQEEIEFLAEPQQPDEIGRFGGYRILSVLGAGGMGVVFKAEDPQLKRLVALKAMKPTVAASDAAKERFLREARSTAAIEHPNIVPIYEVGEDGRNPYIAMQFLHGESLQDRIDLEGKLSQQDVIRLGQEIAAGLQAAHESGLIHRDIKPDNIWLDEKTG